VPEPFDISICICTFRRPEGLLHLLQSLAQLRQPSACRVEVVVVDNDAKQSARQIVEGLSPSYPLALRYFCEERSGVSYARNRCVEESRGEWIAFVDDDEYADPEWLAEYWALSHSQAVDGMFGPVLAEFAEPPKPWLMATGAHMKARHATGRVLDWGGACATCNVMFRRKLHEEVGKFDIRLAASGGEDNDFFWRCIRHGAKLIWCDTAVVHETVPTARMTREWMLTRAYRGGRTHTYLRKRYFGPGAYIVDATRGALSMLAYMPLALGAKLLQHPTSVRYECKVMGGFGKLLGWRPPPGADYARGNT